MSGGASNLPTQNAAVGKEVCAHSLHFSLVHFPLGNWDERIPWLSWEDEVVSSVQAGLHSL